MNAGSASAMEALAKSQSTRELCAPNIVHNEAAES